MLDSYRKKASHYAFTFKDAFYKLIVILLTGTILIWASIFLYAVFYYYYIPKISYSKPVHFQFKPCYDEPGMCSFPSAKVSLSDDNQNRIIIKGQKYKVFLELEMPDSLVNQNLGMFQVKVLMQAKTGGLVDSSYRTAMLHYKSPLVHFIRGILFSLAYLSGTASEKQIVLVELFDFYEESVGAQATEAYIEIQSKHIELYTAKLKIHAHFTGLRFLMFNYPFVSAVAGVTSVLFFLSIGAFVSWYRLFIYPIHKGIVVKVGFEDDCPPVKKTLEHRKAVMKEKIIRERARSFSSSSTVPFTSLPKSSSFKSNLHKLSESKSAQAVGHDSKEFQSTPKSEVSEHESSQVTMDIKQEQEDEQETLRKRTFSLRL